MLNEDQENKLNRYEKTAIEQQERIRQLRLLMEGDLDTETAIDRICRENEELYLEMKSICYELKGIETGNPVEELGTTDYFEASIEKIGNYSWHLILPPFFSISVKRRFSNEGKHIFFLIQNLLQRYEKESEKISVMASPVVCFRHHICTETDRIFDFDNIDSKRAVDAMQGYFLKGDDALYLTVIHEAVKDSSGSYCEIFVTDRAKTTAEFDGIEIKRQRQTDQKR